VQRICYACNRDLVIEPAIEGLSGLLCFPCRYKLDQDGGEQFAADLRNFESQHQEWAAKYQARYDTHCRLEQWGDIAITLPGCSVMFIAIFQSFAASLGPYVFGGCIAGFAIKFTLGRVAKLYSCPSPPYRPSRNGHLPSDPVLVFESNPLADGNPAFVSFTGYPPDWDERRQRCLDRDGQRCRLCGAESRLHIHHIKPISYGGTHTLQNLITLCYRCHEIQRYFRHDELVRRAKWFRRFGRFRRSNQ
jgi:hypothetical protein